MADASISREELLERYLEQLPFEPYPIQEDALYTWFSADQGVLVCTPTGTGKTVIAEAALFEALHTGKTAYYTTPLIALTEQKFREMQEAAVRWGFEPTDVGLVTGNRRENPDARILVVVAEILFNRLLHREAFDFDDVAAVVMDEFHSFADAERGIVWEFSLGLLPKHVRTLLLSATVGNAVEFNAWLRQCHQRTLRLVQGDQRKVPLTFQWVPDKLLSEQIEWMAKGTEDQRTTPALIFCFNREECWTIAELLKGKHLIEPARQKTLSEELQRHDWSQGAGPKLRPLLQRGVGVHHAGILPKYRRIVEDLYQRKLLSIATCTETLAAGINLPARSVVLPSIVKGPSGKRKLLEPSSAHQIFGRAGRPQFDSQGYVFVLAHEDDVKILRWKDKFDQIPENTKDPGLLKAKKQLKKKMPKRRATEQYWTEEQFDKLRTAPAGNLASRGPLPWRMLSYMLEASPEVDRVRALVQKRLMDPKRLQRANRDLDQMLLTLWRAGYVTLDPEPIEHDEAENAAPEAKPEQPKNVTELFGIRIDESGREIPKSDQDDKENKEPAYEAKFAHPTERLDLLRMFRGVNPLYGVFLINQLGIADRAERIQAMESVLELPRSIGPAVRVPRQEFLPPGPLATTRLDVQLLQLGLATPEELVEQSRDDDKPYNSMEERVWVLALADKLRRMFDYDFPAVRDVRTFPVWAVGELLEFGGDFNKYITSKRLQKQEGLLFRHFLRMILLLAEFSSLTPPDADEAEWRGDLQEISALLAESCHRVDPTSTEKTLEQAQAEDGKFD